MKCSLARDSPNVKYIRPITAPPTTRPPAVQRPVRRQFASARICNPLLWSCSIKKNWSRYGSDKISPGHTGYPRNSDLL
jgi:hypothetical protein